MVNKNSLGIIEEFGDVGYFGFHNIISNKTKRVCVFPSQSSFMTSLTCPVITPQAVTVSQNCVVN